MIKLRIVGIIVCITFSFIASAQEWTKLNVDELFKAAKEEAFNGDRETSRKMLLHILTDSPNYTDVRILLARTYAWDNNRAKAIDELKTVLELEPTNSDAINALTDVLMWDDQLELALATVNNGLKSYPTFEDYLYKKASILNSLGNYDEAMETVNQLLIINPASERGLLLIKNIKAKRLKYGLSISSGVDHYSTVFDNSYTNRIQLSRINSWGSSIIRLNHTNRFNSKGIQGEIDLYPNIKKGMYAYLNYGFSNNTLFPQHRLGLEVFSKLPKRFETSLGLRYLYFAPNNIVIYTGSLGWYYRSYWISYRPYITPDKFAGTSFSNGFNIRKYFGNPNNYVGIDGRVGYSPDVRIIQGIPTGPIYVLKSQSAGLVVQKELRYNLLGTLNFDVSHQELSFDVGNYVYITSVYTKITYKFSAAKKSKPIK